MVPVRVAAAAERQRMFIETPIHTCANCGNTMICLMLRAAGRVRAAFVPERVLAVIEPAVMVHALPLLKTGQTVVSVDTAVDCASWRLWGLHWGGASRGVARLQT